MRKNPWDSHFYNAKKRCLRPDEKYFKRGITFNLTREDVKEIWFRDRAQQLKEPTIDRIKDEIGYVKSNCRFIEKKLNHFLGYKKQMKPIEQFSLSGKYLNVYEGIRTAAHILGVNPGDICSCLKGRYKTAYGFIWKYSNHNHGGIK